MLDTEEARSHAALMDLVRQLLEQATGVEAHTLYNDAPFHEIGLTSLAILNFNELIQPLFADLNKTLLFDCRCIPGVGALEGEMAVLDLVGLGRQHGREVHVARLVVGRVGVGDVVGQHFGTLGAKAQCLFVNAKRFVETDAHVGETFEG